MLYTNVAQTHIEKALHDWSYITHALRCNYVEEGPLSFFSCNIYFGYKSVIYSEYCRWYNERHIS